MDPNRIFGDFSGAKFGAAKIQKVIVPLGFLVVPVERIELRSSVYKTAALSDAVGVI